MDSYSLLLSKIQTFDPDNATRILGFLLLNGVSDKDLMRLVSGPDTLLLNLIFKAKSQLGLSSNTSRAPISRPSLSLSIPSPTATNGVHPFADPCFDFSRNPSSPSDVSTWSASVFSSNNPISGSVSVPPFVNQSNGDGAGGVSRTNCGDLIDENQFSEYFPFLNESSKHDDLADPRVEFGDEANAHLHKRSFSASDACFGSEDGGGGFVDVGVRPCVYYARGFCKNGNNCKFVHGGFGFPENFDGSGPIVGDVTRLKAVEQHRLAAISPLAMSPYNKYINLLLQQQNDPQRSAAATALMMQEELHRFGRLRSERNAFMMTGLADKLSSASRQIYLTFPADSSFKDEDVSEYFGIYGPVQDVRIPYQQKRMFGFVTFVFPDTVKLILSRGNPHFICNSRVLVKPYKEKGKVLDRRQQFHQQQFERGDLSGCLSPSEMDDLHLGEGNIYSAQETGLRRKLEEADLQQAIELQGRRLINLQLPELKDDQVRHHQRSFSVGAPASFPLQLHNHDNHDVAEGNQDSSNAVAACRLQVNRENDTTCFQNSCSGNSKESSNLLETDDHQSTFSSSTKSAGDFSSFSAAFTAGEEGNANNTISTITTSENNVSPPTSLVSDMAHC